MSFNPVEDCAAKYQQSNVYINRQQILQQIFEILTRRPTNYPVLVGEIGSGRTTCLAQLAYALAEPGIPADLQTIQIKRIDVDMLELQSGDQFAENLNQIVKLDGQFSSPVLFVLDEVDTLCQRNVHHWKTILELMYALTSREKCHLALVCGSDFYHQHIEQNAKLQTLCETIKFQCPDQQDLERVLKSELQKQTTSLSCSDDLIKEIIVAAKNNIKTQALPGSALSLISKMIARGILESANELTSMHLQGVLAGWYGVYVSQQAIAEPKQLLNFTGQLQQSIFGQDKALQQLQKKLPLMALALEAQQHCPCFVFSGPKSVGKRTTATAMHTLLYGEQSNMLTIDLDLADKADVRDMIIQRLEQYQLDGVLLLNADCAKKSLLFYFQQICESRSIQSEAGRHYALDNTVFIFLFNTAYDLSAFDIHQSPTEKTQADGLLQLVVDDMPSLDVLGDDAQLAKHSAVDFAKQRLPAWLNKQAVKVEFEILSYAARLQLIDVFLKHLVQRVMLKYAVALQFGADFSKSLMMELCLNHQSAKEIHDSLKTSVLVPLSSLLLSSEQKQVHLSASDGKVLVN